MAQIHLLNVPELDLNYEHSFSFKDKKSQHDYFLLKQVHQIESKIMVDQDREYVVVEKKLEELNNCNYLILRNNNSNEFNFYFITKKVYKTESVSHLDIKLDYIQTYMFKYDFKESYVDRMHVDRWTENGNFIINNTLEDLEFGDHVISEELKLYELNENFLITATNPLGTLGTNTPPIASEELTDSNSSWGSKPDRARPTWLNPTDFPSIEFPSEPNFDWENGGQDPDIPNDIEPTDPNDDYEEPLDPIESGITPDPNFGNPGSLIESFIVNPKASEDANRTYLNLVNPNITIGSKISNITFENGKYDYSFKNPHIYPYSIYSNPILRDFIRGSLVNIKSKTKIFINEQFTPSPGFTTYKYTIIKKGKGNIPEDYVGLYGVVQRDWGDWFFVKQTNHITDLDKSYIIYFFGFVKTNYNENDELYSLKGSMLEGSFLLNVGESVGFKYFNKNYIYLHAVQFTSSSTKRIFGISRDSSFNTSTEFGIHKIRNKVDILNYPLIELEDIIKPILGLEKLRFPTENGNMIYGNFTEPNGAGVYYQVFNNQSIYSNIDIDKVMCPLKGVVISSGNVFKRFQYGTRIVDSNYVVVKVADNLNLRFYNLSTINVQIGDKLEPGAVIGTIGTLGLINNSSYLNSSGSSVLMTTNKKVSPTEPINVSFVYNAQILGLSFELINEDKSITVVKFANKTEEGIVIPYKLKYEQPIIKKKDFIYNTERINMPSYSDISLRYTEKDNICDSQIPISQPFPIGDIDPLILRDIYNSNKESNDNIKYLVNVNSNNLIKYDLEKINENNINITTQDLYNEEKEDNYDE